MQHLDITLLAIFIDTGIFCRVFRVESAPETSCSLGVPQTMGNVLASDCRSIRVWSVFM